MKIPVPSSPSHRLEGTRGTANGAFSLQNWPSSGWLTTYRWTMRLGEPLARFFLKTRLKAGKEDEYRLDERRGIASLQRPSGGLVWVHGASVGETLSLLPVIERLIARGLKVLITSGTMTSARVIGKRLPPGAFHQFIPLDIPVYMSRFLDHWKPDLVLMAESDLWPNMIASIYRRSIPLILVNARISDRSYKRWMQFPKVARAILSCFSLALTQTSADSERLSVLGMTHVGVSGNLKFDVSAPPASPDTLAMFTGLLAGRTLWAAASTHPGEEEHIAQTHRQLDVRFPSLLTIIIPRHPERGDDIRAICEAKGLKVAQRSRHEPPSPDVNVYLADTIGEMGLFYRLVPVAFIGGSLVAHGGQNPIEPAKLGVALLHGPHVTNFSDVYAALAHARGAICVADGPNLTQSLAHLLYDPATMRTHARAGHATVMELSGAVERTMQSLEPYLMALKISTRAEIKL
jgi:3-deoxy-D-manno-octulosonic-acid transferase